MTTPADHILEAAEKRLIENAQKGNLDAFDELIRLHQDKIYNLSLRLLGNPEDALDLSQEVFLTCFRKIRTFKGRSSLSTWLYRITLNRAKNLWTKRKRRGTSRTVSLDQPLPTGGEQNVPLQLPSSNPGPDRIAADREILARLFEQLDRLSLEHREILLLRFSDGLSYEEIVELTGYSLGTVKSRLNRARGELRKRMEPFV